MLKNAACSFRSAIVTSLFALAIVAVVAFMPVAIANEESSRAGWNRRASVNTSPVDTSILSLLVSPTAFQYRTVRFTGFLAAEHFESVRIFLGEDFLRFGQTEYSVSLGLSEAEFRAAQGLSGKFVIVEGLFEITTKPGSGAGTLVLVNRLEEFGREAAVSP